MHAVVGQNGAGKSTLIRVLSGEIAADEGELFLDGRPVRFALAVGGHRRGHRRHPPGTAARRNASRGRQHLPGPRASRLAGPRGFLRDAPAGNRRDAVARRRPAPGTVGALEAGRRQLVAIARALSLQARLLIMDEPSSLAGPGRGRPPRAARGRPRPPRRRGRLRLAPAGGGSPARPAHHRAARRPPRRHASGGRRQRGRARPADGRAGPWSGRSSPRRARARRNCSASSGSRCPTRHGTAATG